MRGRSGRGVVTGTLVTLVVALVAVSGLWLRSAHADGRLNALLCDGDCGPAYVDAPEPLSGVDVQVDVPAVEAPSADEPDAADVQAAVDRAVRSEALGDHVGVRVTDLATGDELASVGDGAFTPASTTKGLTAFAALTALDPDDRFVTRTVLDGDRLVLVCGGDPFLLA